jgi:long-chain acyl-CoA synthetase
LILDSGFKGEPRGIIDKANEKLNIYQHINSYSVWAGYDFPRTATKKIKRDEVIRTLLKERKENLASSRKSFSKNRAVIELLRSLKEVKPGALSGDLELERDLGLDSLDLAQLSGIIEEKYDIEVNDSYISKNTKISELENLITSPPEKGIRKVPFYNFPFWLPVRMIRTVFQFIIYPFSFLIYRLKVYGKEDLKEIKSPVVFAANHTSILDSFVILYSLPFSIRRKVVVLMSIEYHFRHFFYNTGAWWIRVIEAAGFYLLVNLFINAAPISRTYGFKKVMENTGKIIDKGWHILIYPEGMVTTDGYVKKFEPGVGIIALDMGVPVIPVKVKGLFNILRNGVLPWGHLPVRPVVEVFFSKMLKFRESGYRGYREIASIIEEKVKAL